MRQNLLIWPRVALLLLALLLITPGGAAGSDASSVLTVQVEGQKPLKYTASELTRLPRQTVRARDHSGRERDFAGVLLRDLLTQAGEPVEKALTKDRLATVVLVTGADGHRVAFSLAELDAGYGNQKVLMADEVAGLKLKPEHGPWRLVVPSDRHHGRWIRQVIKVRVQRLAE
jgi:DMSO/TMAO reductase YedYZ molybdopterin-dependent catalytic subunit